MPATPAHPRIFQGDISNMRLNMKHLFVALTAALALSSPAIAEPSNSTPHARACMKKYGFTYAEWRAYTVPAAKAEPYRKCRDAAAR